MMDNTQQDVTALAIAWRLWQRLFFHTPGTLLPVSIPLERVTSVFHAFCGPGTWAINLAKTHPGIQITATDPNPQMIQIARADARLTGVSNITFATWSPTQSLPYQGGTFDLAYVYSAMRPALLRQYTTALEHLLDVVRPGGWLCLTDFEPGPTSSSAVETLVILLREISLEAGTSAAEDGTAFSSAVYYPRLLDEIGCSNVHYTLTPIDLGNQPGSFGRDHLLSPLATSLQVAERLIQTGRMTQEGLDELFECIRDEMQQESYCAVGMLISTIGTKP